MKPMNAAALLLAVLAAGCTVYQSDGPQEKDDRVFVCHEGTRTLRVSDEEARQYLQQGATLGMCQGT
ncbi:MAG: hypothetical protein AAGE01_11740 [Pseudomonadota bacterium]